jgi:acyl-CoA dehydrogenase
VTAPSVSGLFPAVSLAAAARSDRRLEALRAQAREFVTDEIASGGFVPTCDAWLSGWDPAFSRRLAERGWLGLTLPSEYGGGGRSPLDRYVVTEELLAAGAPVAAHWIADRQVGPSLLRYGSEVQRRRFLPGIVRGEVYFSIGMSEPDSGSDLASVRTRAERVDGGWMLNGTKTWTSGAHHAHAFFVLARSATVEGDRRAGLSQFIVPLDSAGIGIRPIRLLTGAHHFNEVVLQDVFVPDDMVLGEIGQGWRQVSSELAFERSGPERFLSTYPLFSAVLDELGEKAAGDRAVTRAVGLIVARVWTLRQLSFTVAASLACGVAEELPAALVKDLGTRFEGELIQACRLLVQIEPDPAGAGPAGILARAVLHAPGFTLRGGTNEILRGIVAKGLGLR